MRAAVLILALATLSLNIAACAWREMAKDGAKGAGVGFTVNGPLGGLIGFIAAAVGSGIVREIEKRQLRRSGVLTDKRARIEAITARTERPPSPPQSLFPTDSTLGD